MAEKEAADSRADEADSRAEEFGRAYSQLCHLLALTKSGKVDAALDDLVATTLVLDADLGAQDDTAISTAIFGYFGLKPPRHDVQEALRRLEDRGDLRRDASGCISVSTPVAEAISKRSADARELEQAVREEWTASLEAPTPAMADWPVKLWAGLQAVMAESFMRHGVLTIQLIDAGLGAAPNSSFSSTVERAAERVGLVKQRDWFRHAVAVFYNEQTDQRSRYLAQLLDGTFSFYALTVDRTTASYLQKTVSQLDLFLDTNFIFAVLEFHQDYFAAVSREAIALIRDSKLPITLYYHERTLREIDSTIFAIGARLREHRWTKALSRAAVGYANATGRLSGIELAYHRLNAETGVDTDTFLAKYEHIEHVLDGEGFKIFREPSNKPSYSLEEKGMLIAEYLEFCKGMRPGRPKAYEAADHDMTVWLSLRRLRHASRSALETGALLLSNDYLLFSFDWSRLRQRPDSGTVVLPTQLLQLLRPFVPSTDEYDRRFAETFAVPEFRTSHTGYAETTSKVLGILATFKDLPEATAAKILRDEVISTRLRPLNDRSREAREAIESVIVRDNESLLEEREALQSELATRDQADSLRENPGAIARDRRQLTRNKELLDQTIEDRRQLETQLETQRTATARETRRADQANAMLRGVSAVIVLAVTIAILIAVNLPGLGLLHDHPKWIGITVLLGLIGVALSSAVAFPSHRNWILGGGLIGALIAIATII